MLRIYTITKMVKKKKIKGGKEVVVPTKLLLGKYLVGKEQGVVGFNPEKS